MKCPGYGAAPDQSGWTIGHCVPSRFQPATAAVARTLHARAGPAAAVRHRGLPRYGRLTPTPGGRSQERPWAGELPEAGGEWLPLPAYQGTTPDFPCSWRWTWMGGVTGGLGD